jgi:MFS family permease
MRTSSLRRRMRDLSAPLGFREQRLIWIAHVLSEFGDWAARLALAVLVYRRTGSPFLTGLVTTVSLLPWVGVGQILATLGDRWPRRRLMVVSDLVRGAAYLAMLAALPVWGLFVLAFVAALATPPFEAARSALLPLSVPEERYSAAIALGALTSQLALLFGYAAGGGLVAVVGVRGALAVNAATFLVSALVLSGLRIGITGTALVATARKRLGAGVAVIRHDRFVRRALGLYAGAAACAMVPESLVAVYVLNELHESQGTTGLVAAMVPLGTLVGTLLVPHQGRHRDLLRTAAVIVAAGALPAMVGFLLAPSLLWVLPCFAFTGVIFASAVPTNAVAGVRIPDEVRASTFGLVQGVILGAQGLGAAVGGILSNGLGVQTACVVALGTASAIGIAAVIWAPVEGNHFASPVRRPEPALSEQAS